MSRIMVLVAALAVCAAPASAATLTITASRDATLVEQPDGNLANGAGQAFFAGRTNQADNGVRRALLAFDLPAPLGAPGPIRLEKVALVVTVLPSNTPSMEVRLHRVLAPWGEGTSSTSGGGGAPASPGDATWIHAFYPDAFWSHNGAQFSGEPSATTVISEPGVYRFESPRLTRDVLSWVAHPETNLGWILIGDETGRQTVRAFASREFPDTAYRPVLEITYSTNP